MEKAPPAPQIQGVIASKVATEPTDRDRQALPDYMVMGIIGRGSFGVVFKGVHTHKGHFVAIKKLAARKELTDALKTEVDLLKSLTHKNIVKYIEHTASETHMYIVMAYIENGSLASLVKLHGMLPESLVQVYVTQLLEGLKYLHEQGVIHRDIKGANILICTDGTIKLTDFGVSVRYDLLDKSKDNVAGTPNWMAPEIIQMQTPTPACDIWSVGATIIELLTGTPPYGDLPQHAAIYKIVVEDHPPLPTGISTTLQDFLLNCFKKDENIRASAKQLLAHSWARSASLLSADGTDFEHTKEEIVKFNQQLESAAAVQSSLPKPSIVRQRTRTLSKEEIPRVPSMNGMLQLAQPQNNVAAPFRALLQPPENHDDKELAGDSDDLLQGLELKGTPQLKLREPLMTTGSFDEEIDFDMFEDDNKEDSKDKDGERFRLVLQQQIITLLNQLSGPISEQTGVACSRLCEIFESHPQEALILVQPGLAAPFLKDKLKSPLPFLPILSILQTATISWSAPGMQDVATAALTLVNVACSVCPDAIPVICDLQAIPLISTFALLRYQPSLRLQAATFALRFCQDPITLQMFLLSDGVGTIYELLQVPSFSQCKDVLHMGLQCLRTLVRSRHVKVSLCHLFSRTGLVEHITYLMVILSNKSSEPQDFDDDSDIPSLSLLASDSLFYLSSLSYTPFNKRFCQQSVLKRFELFLHLSPRTDSEFSLLLSLLKILTHVSSDLSVREAMGTSGMIQALVKVLSSQCSNKSRTGMEIVNQALNILFNLCTLNSKRTTIAAECGIVPVLHRAIREDWAKKDQLLPIFFGLPRSSEKTRAILMESGSLDYYLDLLSEKSWCYDACDAIACLLNHDAENVTPVLLDPKNCEKILSLITSHAKKRDFLKILGPIERIVRSSPLLCLAIVAMGSVPEILVLAEKDPDPSCRLSLLKILRVLFEACEQFGDEAVSEPQPGNAAATPAAASPQSQEQKEGTAPPVPTIVVQSANGGIRPKFPQVPSTRGASRNPTPPPSSPRVASVLLPVADRLAREDPSDLVRDVASQLNSLLRSKARHRSVSYIEVSLKKLVNPLLFS